MKNKLVINISRQISSIWNHFVSCKFYQKLKLVFYQTLIFQYMNRKVKISLYRKFKHACITRIHLLYINQLNLFWSIYSWKQISVKQKLKNQYPNIKLVCVVHLSISTILSFTHRSKIHKPKLGYLSLLDDLHLQVDSIPNRDPPSANE